MRMFNKQDLKLNFYAFMAVIEKQSKQGSNSNLLLFCNSILHSLACLHIHRRLMFICLIHSVVINIDFCWVNLILIHMTMQRPLRMYECLWHWQVYLCYWFNDTVLVKQKMPAEITSFLYMMMISLVWVEWYLMGIQRILSLKDCIVLQLLYILLSTFIIFYVDLGFCSLWIADYLTNRPKIDFYVKFRTYNQSVLVF